MLKPNKIAENKVSNNVNLEQVKFLGIIMDNRLLWEPHFKFVPAKLSSYLPPKELEKTPTR